MSRFLFRVKDDQGTEVVLKFGTWYNHILVRHPDLQKYFDKLKIVISRPACVYESTGYQTGCSFWKLGLGVGKRARHWLVVVVNYKWKRTGRKQYGEVVTAYFSPNSPSASVRRLR